MTRVDALKELAAKVEAGKWWADIGIAKAACTKAGLPGRPCTRAFNGSLDAAKALHEAVLGEDWAWAIYGPESEIGQSSVALGGSAEDGEYVSEFSRHSAARAWLLAILRALIAQEESA